MRRVLLLASLLCACACDGGGGGAGGGTSGATSRASAQATGAGGALACLPESYYGCSDTHPCCAGLKCFAPEGRCLAEACLDYGEICAADSCCPSQPCAAGLPCCNPVAFDPCATDLECCSHLCDPKTHRCACSPPGGSCTYEDGDCCGKGLCRGLFGSPTGTCCLDYLEACKQPSDCCSGLCGSGHCQ